MLDFVFRPLLQIVGPLWTVIILSFILGLMTTIAHKYMTDQKLLKNAREEMKKLQAKMRQHKDNPKKLMEVQQKMMSYNMDILKQSFRPLLVTFIPVIIIFGWITAALVFQPIVADETFTSTVTVIGDGVVTASSETLYIANKSIQTSNGIAVFSFSGLDGDHVITYDYNGVIAEQKVRIGETYENPRVAVKKPFKSIEANLAKLELMNLGFWKPTGFGAYIIFTIVFSLLLRKLLNVA
jgi:uncharacterized membrane protein (DUF106 family)